MSTQEIADLVTEADKAIAPFVALLADDEWTKFHTDDEDALLGRIKWKQGEPEPPTITMADLRDLVAVVTSLVAVIQNQAEKGA